jgi:hypothetical protein
VDAEAFVAYVTDLWLDAIGTAYKIARGSHYSRLSGKWVKARDGRGVDPFSEAIGAAEACARLVPALQADFDPVDLRRAGEHDALRQMADELRRFEE